jgi:hypothetical protein
MSNTTRRAALLLSAPLVLGFILAPVVLLADSSPLAVVTTASASIFVVTSVGDSGAGSLRQAILDANAHPGTDTIVFNIPGSGLHTITPSTALPTISDPVTIDGSSQPGFTGSPIIELNGSQAGVGVDGLRIIAGSSVVSALVINRFSSDGLELSNQGGNVVEGCFIGTDATGTVDLGNAFHGLNVASSNNRIGSTAAAARNVISGNDNSGILITAGTTGNLVQGNFIGTDAAGASAIGNGNGVVTEGQSANSSSHTIGGTAPGARNVISGNNGRGISLGGTVSGNLVQGNFIGTDVTGNTAVGNLSDGVLINFGSANNTIGGTTPAARNVISGNGGNGVRSDYHPNTVQGTFIGTQGDGVSPLGNGLNGVLINFGDNAIGGSASGAGNTIAFNGGTGVLIVGSSSPVSSNAVFANADLGIDLDGDGVTPNDHCDANSPQNFPVITSASFGGGMVTLSGTLDSVPNTTFRLEFFSSPECNAAPPNDFGEGETFLGSTNVMTGNCPPDPNQPNATFGPLSFLLPTGHTIVTATATRLDGNGNPIDTSEFSQCSDTFATPTPTPTPTSTATLTPTPAATPTAAPTVTPSATPTPTATPTPKPTATPSVTPSPSPTATATITPTPTLTPTPTATPIQTATPTTTPRLTPTPRLVPTPRPRPTPGPRFN